jgi:mannose-6-phosphate isomerase
MSIIANGVYKGQSLLSLLETNREAILGTNVCERYGTLFPVLIKIIDADDRLSVQVHPDDVYAVQHGEKNGKNEIWYVIDAKKDAKLIYGLKEGTTKEKFMCAVEENEIGTILKEISVKAGDAIYIPAGTVHAILSGILIAEIQQNSNTTYRIYDWDRVDLNGNKRELNIS